MKFIRLGAPGKELPAILDNDKAWDISQIAGDIDGVFLSEDGVAAAKEALANNELVEIKDYNKLRMGPPIATPKKIVCVGLNYREHAHETNAPIPEEPVVFMKDPSTVIGPFDDVLIPKKSVKSDWEVELGVVIGKKARYLDSPSDSKAHIAGYVLSHDVSEREFQLERGGQWDKGKSCETFNPLGPYFVPSEEIDNPQNLDLQLWVNGELRQSSSTSDQIFSIDYLVWYLSQFMVLNPGDLINTGTPAGVALGIPGNPYLREGDVVTLEIEGLGRSEQRMVNAK